MFIYKESAWFSFMGFVSGKPHERHIDDVELSATDRYLTPEGIHCFGKHSHRVVCRDFGSMFTVSLQEINSRSSPPDFIPVDPIRLRETVIDLGLRPTAYYEVVTDSQAYLFDKMTESQMMTVRLRLF